MDDRGLAEALPDLLPRWDLADAVVTPLGGGMNSATAQVRSDAGSWVAKWVPERSANALLAGCETAAIVEAAGIPAGAARRAAGGSLALSLGAGVVVLLEEVAGRPLTGESDDEQRLMAEVLHAAHRATDLGEQQEHFHETWLTPGAFTPGWLASVLTRMHAEYATLPPLRWARLHNDPAPEAFRHDPESGRTGLIDWAGSTPGPVLYDVASAVMYLGGPNHAGAFLTAYGDAAAEHLDTFRRLRWCVQATYFVDRLSRHDLTGIDDRSHNEKGLEDARRGLQGLGMECGPLDP
jgi:homoserine kinase type II